MTTALSRLRAARRAPGLEPEGPEALEVITCAPSVLFARALGDPGLRLRAVTRHGATIALPVARWLGPPTAAEDEALAGVEGPALDIGCGPGRHVAALHRRGVLAVGVELATDAARLARSRGALVIEGSVFSPLPGEGTWRSALLLDGNIGIGGRPRTLLRRVCSLLAPEGHALVELDPPGVPATQHEVRLEAGDQVSAWFPWATMGADAVEGVAGGAGLAVSALWERERRWFARLVPARASDQGPT